MNLNESPTFSGVITLVIALDSSTRNPDLPRQLNEQFIPFQIVKAVDGRKWTTPYDEGLVDLDCFVAVLGRKPLGAEIGCALSHIECINRAKLSGADYALIFEDDANVIADLARTIEIIKSLDDGSPAVFQLHSYGDSMIRRESLQIIDQTKAQVVGNFFKPPRSAAAYCLNRSAIEISSKYQTVKGVADWPPYAHSFRFWGFFPCPVMLADLPSTIEPSSTKIELHHKKDVAVILRDYLRLYKISSFREFSRCLGGTSSYIRHVILPNTIYLLRYQRTRYHGITPHTYRTR
jgi:hypothetical protein